MPNQKRYTYKGQVYQFMFTGKMKIGQVWIVCCIYKSYKDGRIYVRERGDFNEKFQKVVDKVDETVPIAESGPKYKIPKQ